MNHPTLRHALVCAAFLPLAVHAQPVLNDIGDLLIGMEIDYLNVQPQTLDLLPAGANITWDLSNLGTSTDTTKQMIVHPDSSQYSPLFPAASLIEINSDSSQAFIQRGTPDRLVGYVSSEGFVINYPDPYDFLTRPFTYQDSLADTSVRSYYFGENEISGFGSTLTHADAYGTLILPNGSYTEVLRVRFEQFYSDTDVTSGMVTSTNIISYCWFDQEHRGALLKVDSIFISSMFFSDTIGSVRYLVHETPLAMKEPQAIPINVYYSGSEIAIREDLSAGDAIEMRVFDAAGKLMYRMEHMVHATGAFHSIPFPTSLSKAINFVRIAITGNGSSRSGTIKIFN